MTYREPWHEPPELPHEARNHSAPTAGGAKTAEHAKRHGLRYGIILGFALIVLLVVLSTRNWQSKPAPKLQQTPERVCSHGWERRRGTVDNYAFPSRVDHPNHLSTRQYARPVDEWVTAIGLRRTFASAYQGCDHLKATGNLRAIQILLGTKIENTVRYLRVDIEDALELAVVGPPNVAQAILSFPDFLQ